MWYIVVFVCFVVSAFGAPANTDVVPLEKQQPTVIPIVSQSDELEPNGTYHFSYETGNGIKRDEISYDRMVPKAAGRSADSNEGGEDSNGDSDSIHVQIGSYSYTAPDGSLISVRYIADENGFRPVGDHIPRVPSVSDGSSSEKSGRALKAADNTESASAPKAVEKPQVKSAASAPLSNTVPASKSAETEKPTSAPVPEKSEVTDSGASTTEAAKAIEGASTTESSSTELSSTEAASTEGTSTKTESTEAASTEAPSSTEAPTTPVAGASTTFSDSSTAAAEQSTSNAETSTTEAAKPTTVAA